MVFTVVQPQYRAMQRGYPLHRIEAKTRRAAMNIQQSKRAGSDATQQASGLASWNTAVASVSSPPTSLPQGEGSAERPPMRAGSWVSGNRRLAEVVQFTSSAIALWAMCALGIYLIQPGQPEADIPAVLASQALAVADVGSLRAQPQGVQP
jgi:hypothetical protein